jgi:hypothetical protein
MAVFGVDIDSRDTTLLLETAKAVAPAEIEAARDGNFIARPQAPPEVGTSHARCDIGGPHLTP